MPNISDFPLPPAAARARIRDIFLEGRVRIPTPPGGPWERTVTTRQIMACLEHGEIVGQGIRNEHGHYAYRLRRYAAGVAILVDLVLYRDDGEWTLRITGVSHE
jgi:uncharacterized heparinase superfamily protein